MSELTHPFLGNIWKKAGLKKSDKEPFHGLTHFCYLFHTYSLAV